MQSTPITAINGKEYLVNQEIFFHKDTHERVIMLLCNAHANNTRLKIFLGDTKTKKLWEDDPEIGYIGRSTGQIKIPLLIKNKRSFGGGGLLTQCIVKIEYANKKNGGVLFDITK